GPGVDSAIPMNWSTCVIVKYPFDTTSVRISGIIAYPPPNVNNPIWKKIRNSFNNSRITIIIYLLLFKERCHDTQIGRASCRERAKISVVAGSDQKNDE